MNKTFIAAMLTISIPFGVWAAGMAKDYYDCNKESAEQLKDITAESGDFKTPKSCFVFNAKAQVTERILTQD